MKLLVRATNWVGDAIMSIPALEAIRRRWPEAQISILAREWVADLYREQAFADEILTLDRHSSPDGRDRASVANKLAIKRFDSALLLPNAFNAAWIAFRAGVPERIGYARDGRSSLLTKAVRVPKEGEVPRHECYYYLELLRRIGWIDQLPDVSAICLRVASESVAAGRLKLVAAGARADRTWIALAPGAAYGSAKCWPPERFARAADRLVADFKADVVLFGTAAERDVAQRIAARMRHHPVNLAGDTPIAELPSLFAACHLFIGNDSGAMHVAAAAGIPVVAVFGSTDPGGTAPMTLRKTLVQEPVSCSPCFLRHCPVDHRCMTRIEDDAVYDAARNWLEPLFRG